MTVITARKLIPKSECNKSVFGLRLLPVGDFSFVCLFGQQDSDFSDGCSFLHLQADTTLPTNPHMATQLVMTCRCERQGNGSYKEKIHDRFVTTWPDRASEALRETVVSGQQS